MSFLLPLDLSLASSPRTLFEGSVKTFFDKPLTTPFNRSPTDVQRFFDRDITPTSIRLISICFQKNSSMVDLIGSMLSRCCELLKELPFFFTQSNNVLFNHRFDVECSLFTIALTRQIFPDRLLDLLDSRFQVIESDLWGLPDSFRDRYREVGQSADPISQRMVQQQIPVHHLSVQSLEDWHQSKLYQDVFCVYGLEHGMVAPLIGAGRLIGGIYFMRGKELPGFNDTDLIQLSPLYQHLSVRLATLRFVIAPSSIDRLTPREVEIAELVAQGFSNREIGLKLNISRDAVKQALKRMFQKLDVSARAEMIAKLKG